MPEENIYNDNSVSITTARIIVSGTTYAPRNITLVKQAPAPAKISGMTPDLYRARIKLKRTRPKKCVFECAIIGPIPS
jgi:hypothetical protein